MDDSDLTDWFFNLFPDNNVTTLEVSGGGVNLFSYRHHPTPKNERQRRLVFSGFRCPMPRRRDLLGPYSLRSC
jgi:hypothetical protein